MGVVAQSIVNSPIGAGCFGAYSEFYMTAYGDINPCDFNPISFGNVRDLPIQAIWHRMVSHPDFCQRHLTCRMQTQSYRSRYIDILPDDFKLPVPIEEVEAIRAENEKAKLPSKA
jgi:MoaA/NifB/PqqE/SkfB family radical SAM enzyme